MPTLAEEHKRPLPPLERRVDFIAQARRFAEDRHLDPAFRFLQAFCRCGSGELKSVLAKIYCESLPVNYGNDETTSISLVKALVHPFHYAATRKWLWRPRARVQFELETTDRSYFERRYRRLFEALPSSKRITALDGASFKDYPAELSEPVNGYITLRCLLYFFAAPAFIPALWSLSRRYGLNLLSGFRKALGIYASFDAHFRRNPCRNFITYADEMNHPCRHLAFKQLCGGSLFVVQNGERSRHPAYAFGAMDVYLAFGEHMAELARDLQMSVRRVAATGALNLNEWRALLAEVSAAPAAEPIDILLIDQLVWPHNGFDEKTGRALTKIFDNLARLKRDRPDLRVAYQMRYYGGAWPEEAVRATLARHFPEGLEILDNQGKGESYRNIYRSRLMLCFNSTLGYEAYFFGHGDKKVLFVNYADNPYEIYSEDPRFQIYDKDADYASFRRHVEMLLALELKEVPAEARRRHAFFDGRVQERMAEIVLAESRKAR